MRKALFLDRDGVINIEKEYLYNIEAVEFVEGIFKLCRFYQERSFDIVIVTNQSGIARGMYTMEAFNRLMEWMKGRFLEEGIEIKAIYCCPHHPDFTGACACRKPEPGMLLQAAREYDIDLKHSFLIGDSERDIEAAFRAGLPYAYLLSSKPCHSKATRCIKSLNELIKEPCCA